jgi:virulence factor Mce-like protein
MRRREGLIQDMTGNPVLIGAVALLLTVVGVFLSYNANEGLPFVPTYEVTADVPDAAELVRGDEVRVGGARVGQVQEIKAMPAEGSRAPYARLTLALNVDQQPLPVDTRVQVRPRSILGSKYLALTPGRSRRGVPPGGRLPLRQAVAVVELDEAFNVFDAETTRGLRGAVAGLGDALAGRGSSFNQAVESTRRLLPPLQRVLAVLVSPRTDLAGFLDGAAATADALAPVAVTLGSLFDRAAVTMAALDAAGGALGETIDQLAPTEAAGTRVLLRVTPVLADAAALARGLRAGARFLPTATRHLAGSLEAAVPVLRDTKGDRLGAALSALDRFARDPASLGTARKLMAAVQSLHPTLRFLAPAQTECNVFGTWARNLISSLSEGDAAGTWLRFVPLQGNSHQTFQQSTQDPELHVNFYAREDATECEAGNEPYLPGRRLGNPPGNQGKAHPQTAPPPGVPELARRAGLWPSAPGAGP